MTRDEIEIRDSVNRGGGEGEDSRAVRGIPNALLRAYLEASYSEVVGKGPSALKREPIEVQRTLFRGIGRGKGALEEKYAREWGLVAGVDEVGRGPLAGPVVAAAVILPPDHKIRGIADSKELTHEKRVELAEKIKARAIAWGVGVVSVEEIDRINILKASLKAMEIAVAGLATQPGGLLIDGIFKIPGHPLPQQPVIKGDSRCRCIGAASILAKVHRDAMMVELDALHPGYGFAEHKGYSCPSHRAALRTLGPSPVHRRSFDGVVPRDENQDVLDFEAASQAHLVKGETAEARAAAYLESNGWDIVEQNYRCKAGELDVVASKADVLAFVEVKMREKDGAFSPLDNMTPKKVRKIVNAARRWLVENEDDIDGLYPRFDVITIVGAGEGAKVEHLEGAFEAPDG